MGIFRSYFSKNNTLIKYNETNNSQNPVTEISYGTEQKQVTRFIFDIDLNSLKTRIENELINVNKIEKHILHLTNTIKYSPEYIGNRSYDSSIQRTSGFDLDLFNISEDWEEGSGYDFIYNDAVYFPTINKNPSNWNYKKIEIPWQYSGGSYNSGLTTIFGTQHFETGNENIEIDITDYINGRLNISGLTGYTGTSYGLGIKFTDFFEELKTTYRQAVSFYAKDTHTFYEPYVETIYDDSICDDRNYFFLNKNNKLYLYLNKNLDINVNFVEIYDYKNKLIDTISGDTYIEKIGHGIYCINYYVDSDEYPDAVLFKDIWHLDVNGKDFKYTDTFYLINEENYITKQRNINFDNYHIYVDGINENEKIIAGDIKNVRLRIKEFYANQDRNVDFDVEYRLYIKNGDKYEVDIIPLTKVNRTKFGYEFNLDTYWLIPQDYILEIKLNFDNFNKVVQTINFVVLSNKLKNLN